MKSAVFVLVALSHLWAVLAFQPGTSPISTAITTTKSSPESDTCLSYGAALDYPQTRGDYRTDSYSNYGMNRYNRGGYYNQPYYNSYGRSNYRDSYYNNYDPNSSYARSGYGYGYGYGNGRSYGMTPYYNNYRGSQGWPHGSYSSSYYPRDRYNYNDYGSQARRNSYNSWPRDYRYNNNYYSRRSPSYSNYNSNYYGRDSPYYSNYNNGYSNYNSGYYNRRSPYNSYNRRGHYNDYGYNNYSSGYGYGQPRRWSNDNTYNYGRSTRRANGYYY